MIYKISNNLYTILILSFLSNLVFVFVESSLSSSLLLFLMVSTLFFYFVINLKYGLFLPSNLFVISVLVFIVSRPLFAAILGKEIIQAGNEMDMEYLNRTYIFLINSMLFMYLLTYLLRTVDGFKKYLTLMRLPIISIGHWYYVIVIMFFIFGIAFIINSLNVFEKLGTTSYFDVASSETFKEHFFYFFMAKYMAFFLLYFSRNSRSIVLIILCLFLFSIGFTLIGLRGFTIAYFFSFLVVFSFYKKIKLWFVLLLIIFIPIISGIVLELRLGFSVFDGYFSMLYMFFYQQGATFEVIYGTVSSLDEIRRCIPLEEFFFGDTSFGACVDSSRGVFFAEGGGFASSFFAEIYYLGFISVFLILSLVSVLLKFLDDIYIYVSSVVASSDENVGPLELSYIIFLFMVVPNLIYIARSSAFDFLTKVLILFILFCLVRLLFLKRR